MKRLVRIVRITSVKGYRVYTVWTNGEKRVTDFVPLIRQWISEGDLQFEPLTDPGVFRTIAKSSSGTLYWPEVTVDIKLNSKTITAALEIDPVTIYENSKLIGSYQRPNIGALLKKARESAGLSQSEVAANSGTSRNYISRIENEQSDIQIETLFKIVQLGMGEKIRIVIEPSSKSKRKTQLTTD